MEGKDSTTELLLLLLNAALGILFPIRIFSIVNWCLSKFSTCLSNSKRSDTLLINSSKFSYSQCFSTPCNDCPDQGSLADATAENYHVLSLWE